MDRQEYVFGFSLMKYGDFFIPVADPEKILIDMVYCREFIPEETKAALLDSIDRELLSEYLLRLSIPTKKRVLSVLNYQY